MVNTPPKKIFIGKDAQDLLSEGVNTLADVVASTMGAQGRFVACDRSRFGTLVTKDGVTVANEVVLEDPGTNIGANMIRTAANTTNEVAGDGTTTATVLARAIYNNGRKAISMGVNIADLRKGIQLASAATIDYIKSQSKKVVGDDLVKIATISSNNDKELGKIIADAINSVDGGVVTVEPSHTSETIHDVIQGFKFDKGLLSPYFVTDEKRDEATFSSTGGSKSLPYIFVSTVNLSCLDDILPMLNKASKENIPIIFMADDFGQEVLQTLVLNNIKGKIKTAAVKCPGYGENKQKLCDDIATLTGAQLVTQENYSLANGEGGFSLEFCGRAKSIVIDKYSTTILEGQGSQDAIERRIEKLQDEANNPHASGFEVDQLRDRISRIRGGVAVIRVGGLTEEEVVEKRARVEDAVRASMSALQEGVVIGGGLAYLNALKHIRSLASNRRDEQEGINILAKALEAPTKQIITNSGHDAAEAVLKIITNDNPSWGFNAATEEFSDLLEDGVIDPTKVTRVALENAVSVALLLLTTHSVLVESKYREDDPRVEPKTLPRPIMQKHS